MSEPKDNEQHNTNHNICEIFPEYLIAFILSFVSHKQQSLIAHISKDFNTAFELNSAQQSSISIEWNSISIKWNDNNDFVCISQDGRKNVPYAINSKNGFLYASYSGNDNRIFIDDRIILRPSWITTYKNIHDKELGIFIETTIGSNSVHPGSWNVGFGIGHNRFAFHPGYGSGGAARLEGANGWGNESMGFDPKCDIPYRFEIFLTIQSMIYLKVSDQSNKENEYVKQWKYTGSLFINKQDACMIFKRKTFSLRSHVVNQKAEKIAMYGNIYLNVAERNKINGKIRVIDRQTARNDGIKLNAFKAHIDVVDDTIQNLSCKLENLKQMVQSIVGKGNDVIYNEYQSEFVRNEMRKMRQKLDALLLQVHNK